MDIGCSGDIHYKKYLEKMIEELELKENIEFKAYFPKHSDMLKHIQQAKYAESNERTRTFHKNAK